MFLRTLVLMVLALTASSCQTLDHRVIEKSKKDRPEWLRKPYGGLRKTASNGFVLVYQKADVQDLALGIDQSRSQASAHFMKELLGDMIKNRQSYVSKSKKDQIEISRIGMNGLEQALQEAALIRDIYFEKIQAVGQIQAEESYRIYVLCRISANDLKKAQEQVEALWRQS
ncbi:hypothetical protein [Pseudobacteriovorax antillogorgiicola]|uniref:LPP20 lipoprotein n=1 Tax=Pseudobacteriovorax antillogorgiicola TaxID=1513793 RepID=A0A1Y6B2B5_9BACT|nr:hypothetical protein [Pseudobacteriovorax antillogorgiicola]TCS59499.1 hypothetical protein EDD56_101419 [Pseudobacteriovorax antillogorgiicola]SME87904.1 hypothetical protein SAMN06296036_10166 [Pseudobacteriovorax antillogorgiicola]